MAPTAPVNGVSVTPKRVTCAVRIRSASDCGKTDGLFNFGNSSRGIINIHNPLVKGDGPHVADREFLLDAVHDWSVSQDALFNQTVKPCVNQFIGGNNVCIFAYGSTKSGKTHTLLGSTGDAAGMVPKALDYLFAVGKDRYAMKRKFSLQLAAHENYCENLRNLGCQHKGKTYLDTIPLIELHDDAGGKVEADGLTLNPITTTAEALHIINSGRATNRRVSQENIENHSIYVVTLVLTQSDPDKGMFSSKLHFIDMASPDRVPPTQSGQKQREHPIVVKTHDTVAKVLATLSSGGPNDFPPYKDSKLTRYLKDSLVASYAPSVAGPYALVIATLDPIPCAYEDSYATLVYANRCRNGKPSDSNNIDMSDPAEQARLIEKLTTEVFSLKEQLAAAHDYYQRKLTESKPILEQMEPSRPQSSKSETMSELSDGKAMQRRASVGNADNAGFSEGEKKEGRSRANSGIGAQLLGSVAPQLDHQMSSFLTKQYGSEIRELKEKLNKRGAELRELRESFNKTQNHLRQELEAQRQKSNNLYQELKELRQSSEDKLHQTEERYQRELELLKAHNSRVVDEMMKQLESVPENIKQISNQYRTIQAIKADDKQKLESHYTEVVRHMDETRDNALTQQKQQYEYWLDKKVQEMRTFIRQYNAYKQSKEDEIEVLSQQLTTVFSYAQALATVIENYENGLYAVYEKSGIKVVSIPPQHKPGPLPESLLRMISKYRQRASDLMEINLAAQQQLKSTSDSTHSGVGSVVNVTNDAPPARTKTRERQKMEEEVLNDLADHPTIEYIKQLEDERDYYKSQLQEEVLANRNAKISLDSKERQIQKLKLAASTTSGRSTSMSFNYRTTNSPSRLSRPQTQMS